MTRTKAMKILERHGFVLQSELQKYDALTIVHPMTGSMIIGRIYSESLYINLNGNSKSTIWFNFGTGASSTAFEKSVDKLADELKHYDEILRQERVESVQRYFNVRKQKREHIKWLIRKLQSELEGRLEHERT